MKLVGLPVTSQYIQFTNVEEGYKDLFITAIKPYREVSSDVFF